MLFGYNIRQRKADGFAANGSLLNCYSSRNDQRHMLKEAEGRRCDSTMNGGKGLITEYLALHGLNCKTISPVP
jgi:hypothetical protein